MTGSCHDSTLLALMRQLAAWVQAHCENDELILLSSGFKPTKAPAPIGPLLAPNAPAVRYGPYTGTLKARVRKVNGAYAYNWRIALATAPTVYVQTAQTTGGRYLFTGLTPGQIYRVQVDALGSLGESDWSDVTSLMAV